MRPWLPRASLGRRGENAAARHLVRKGYRILARNLEQGKYELDIVAQKGDTIAFVEVKTRVTVEEIRPEDSVGRVKRQHIRKAARRYIQQYDDGQTYFRYDIVSVTMPGKRPTAIDHIENAFGADE